MRTEKRKRKRKRKKLISRFKRQMHKLHRLNPPKIKTTTFQIAELV